MYFDDVSRHSIGWKPGKLLKTTNTDVSAFHRSEQKHDAVKRVLLGYNAESASVLSEDEGTFLFSCASTTGLSMMLVSLVYYNIHYRTIDRRQSSNRRNCGRKIMVSSVITLVTSFIEKPWECQCVVRLQ
jgi:hypothetical protein